MRDQSKDIVARDSMLAEIGFPDFCWFWHDELGSLLLQRGAGGYTLMPNRPGSSESVDIANRSRDISRDMTRVMYHGAMHGWDAATLMLQGQMVI